MMEKELIHMFESVKKAADVAAMEGEAELSAEEARCLDALKQLEKFPVNYQLLVSTQVGKRLRHLTKHPRKKIQVFASHLVEKWKNIVVEETLNNQKNGSLGNKDSSKTDLITEVNSVKVSKVETHEKIDCSGTQKSEKLIKPDVCSFEKKVEEVDAVKVYAREQKKVVKINSKGNQTSELKRPIPATVAPPKLTSIIYCNDPMRDRVREVLSGVLSKVSSEVDEDLRGKVDACDPIRVAVSLESAMFEKFGRSNGAQKNKYRSIMFNIKDASNPDFRRKVLLGYFRPEEIVELTPEEMASNERRLENDKIKEKALFECQRGGPPKASTDAFKCGRCGKKKCTYYQMQTRSADEPMTTFITCVNCEKRWKI